MNNYPYPVLTPDGSAYKDECVFDLKFENSDITDTDITLYYTLSLSSEYLISLINDGYAKAIIRIKSDIFLDSYDADIGGGKTAIRIKSENFKANDSIIATAYIVAVVPFELKWNNELLELFDQSLSIHIRKRDIVAESNREQLSYNLRSNDFIRFMPSEEQNGKGIKISLSDPNYINIVIGTNMNAAYTRKKSDRNINQILASHLIFEAFVYVLCEIVVDSSEYENNDWYRLFNQLFLSTGESIDEFKAQAFDGKADMQQIYQKAQDLINNQLELSLITIAREEER